MTRPPDRIRHLIDRLLAEQDGYEGSAGRDLRRLGREFLVPYRKRLVYGILTTILCGTITYGFALTGRYLVDNALLPDRPDHGIPMDERFRVVVIYFLINMGIWTAYLMALYTRGRSLNRTARDLVLGLRLRLHQKLQALHVGFYDQTPAGRIMSRVLDDIAVIQTAVTSYLMTMIMAVAQLGVGIAVVMYLNWRLGAALAAVLPLYAITYAVLRPRIRSASMALSRQNAKMYSLAAERIAGVRVVQAFGRETSENRGFARLMHDFVRIAMRLLSYNQVLIVITGLISALATGGLLYAAIRNLEHAQMTLGDVIAFTAASGNVFAPIATLTAFGSQLQSTLVSLGRIFGLLDTPQDIKPGTVEIQGSEGRLDIQGVTFTYPAQTTPALRDVSFSFESGEHIAVMGPSGAGKSTLFALLLRFYDPDQGAILLDGIDLHTIEPRSLRRHICMVQQEPSIFSGTITENIMYGHPDATPAEVIRAAKQAELHEFIMSLPGKYETEVGESGVTLSGGQKQRMALATALITNPEILLLDDTTSALDAATEARIRETLRRVLKGRGSLIITQRIATARSCNRIVVLEDGRISAIGTHDELAHTAGFYRQICEKQATM